MGKGSCHVPYLCHMWNSHGEGRQLPPRHPLISTYVPSHVCLQPISKSKCINKLISVKSSETSKINVYRHRYFICLYIYTYIKHIYKYVLKLIYVILTIFWDSIMCSMDKNYSDEEPFYHLNWHLFLMSAKLKCYGARGLQNSLYPNDMKQMIYMRKMDFQC